MGKVGSKLLKPMAKPLKNWNIENRAHKVISQEKPKAAPTYDTTLKQIELVDKLEPDYKETAQKKNQQLDEHLKKVYVTSDNVDVQEFDLRSRSNPDRPLPKDRLVHEGFQYGFYEPSVVRPGQVSLRQALEFLSNHKNEPEKYTAEYIAIKYKLDKQVVANILEYYSLFTVYHKEEGHDEEIVLTSMPISQRSGIQVPWTDDKPKEISTLKKLQKTFQGPSEEPIPVEEEKKRLT